MHEVFLQRCCMKWVSGDPLMEILMEYSWNTQLIKHNNFSLTQIQIQLVSYLTSKTLKSNILVHNICMFL